MAALLAAVAVFGDAVAPPQTTMAADAACVLTNGTYEAGSFSPWYLQSANGAQATVAADAGASGGTSARITVQQTSADADAWNVQWSYDNATLVAGRRYTLSVRAKASSARTTSVMLQQFNNPFTEIWTDNVQLTTAWQTFQWTIDFPWGAVTATPSLRFNLGQSTGTVWLDDVSLCESGNQTVPTPAPVSANCRVLNGDFETGTLAPWALTTSGSAQAIASADSGAISAMSARISITQTQPTANEQDIRFEQADIPVTANAWTSVQFYARSARGQTVPMTLRNSAGQEYWRQTIRLPDPADDAAFKHYFYVFQMPASATGTATFAFNLGQSAGNVWVDAVHVCGAPVKFQDEFSGSAVDPNKWDFCNEVSKDCADKDYPGLYSWYKPANAPVSNGTLKMRVTKETHTICFGCTMGYSQTFSRTYAYASVYMQSNSQFHTQYGYVEMRGKMPTASSGIWVGLWMAPYIPPNGNLVWPPEIDLLEHFSPFPQLSWHTLHYNTATQFNATDGRQYLNPAGLGEAFHTYAVNWTPKEIIWYVDGMETHRSSRYIVTEAMFLLLSVEVGGLGGPPPSDADLGNTTTEVDYVRVFDNGEAFAFASSGTGGGTTPTPTPIPGSTPAPGSTPTPTPKPTSAPINPNVKARNYLPLVRTK